MGSPWQPSEGRGVSERTFPGVIDRRLAAPGRPGRARPRCEQSCGVAAPILPRRRILPPTRVLAIRGGPPAASLPWLPASGLRYALWKRGRGMDRCDEADGSTRPVHRRPSGRFLPAGARRPTRARRSSMNAVGHQPRSNSAKQVTGLSVTTPSSSKACQMSIQPSDMHVSRLGR